MSTPKCPKCKTVLMSSSTKTPSWRCLICGWIGYKTNILCLRCKKNKIIKGKDTLYCIGCNCFALTPINTKKTTPREIKEIKKGVIKINVSCPNCLNRITSGLSSISNKPTWICKYWLCNWKALKTEKICRRCKNFLSFSENKFHCPYCKKPLFNLKDLEEIKEEIKYLQEEL